jgi:hypothetical protein
MVEVIANTYKNGSILIVLVALNTRSLFISKNFDSSGFSCLRADGFLSLFSGFVCSCE